MGYDDFIATYRRIIAGSVAKLKQGRFATFVVGDFRDKKTGNYYGFPEATVKAFEDVGCHKYNEGILYTSLGTLPMRVAGQFAGNRKMGKSHQNLLVFVKGKFEPWAGAESETI